MKKLDLEKRLSTLKQKEKQLDWAISKQEHIMHQDEFKKEMAEKRLVETKVEYLKLAQIQKSLLMQVSQESEE